ncbi:hypothetical protein KI387_031264, partial [Taxus chinensis]
DSPFPGTGPTRSLLEAIIGAPFATDSKENVDPTRFHYRENMEIERKSRRVYVHRRPRNDKEERMQKTPKPRHVTVEKGTIKPRRETTKQAQNDKSVQKEELNRNYVVQYILEFGIPWATAKVIAQLQGHYALLSMQKFSSNVVEKCLKEGKEEHRAAIIQELLNSSQLGDLLQDAYGNYVVQSALGVSK